MAASLHVPGPVHVLTGTSGGGALEELGLSVDGITINLNHQYDDIFVDSYGPKVRFDRQIFLQDATFSFDLVYFDLAVLNKWRKDNPSGAGAFGSATPGTMGAAGDLVIQNGYAARCLLRSSPINVGLDGNSPCFNFPLCMLEDAEETKYGTIKTVWSLTFRAFLNQQASTSVGSVLWNTTCV